MLLTEAFDLVLWLEARHTLASSSQIIPGSVAAAKVRGKTFNGRVLDARSRPLNDRCHLRSSCRIRENGVVENDARAGYVVDLDRNQRRARAGILESEIDTLHGDRNTARFGIDDCVIDIGEHVIGCDCVDMTIGINIPRRHHRVSEVRFRFVI